MSRLTPLEQEIVDGMFARRPDLSDCVQDLLKLHRALVKTYNAGGKLLLCGNGGSNADAMHIAGELCKSFERLRPLPAKISRKLKTQPMGDDLAKHLEAGLAAIPLGFNGSLKTAVENDSPLRDMAFAQETIALVKPEDVLVGDFHFRERAELPDGDVRGEGNRRHDGIINRSEGRQDGRGGRYRHQGAGNHGQNHPGSALGHLPYVLRID